MDAFFSQNPELSPEEKTSATKLLTALQENASDQKLLCAAFTQGLPIVPLATCSAKKDETTLKGFMSGWFPKDRLRPVIDALLGIQWFTLEEELLHNADKFFGRAWCGSTTGPAPSMSRVCEEENVRKAWEKVHGAAQTNSVTPSDRAALPIIVGDSGSGKTVMQLLFPISDDAPPTIGVRFDVSIGTDRIALEKATAGEDAAVVQDAFYNLVMTRLVGALRKPSNQASGSREGELVANKLEMSCVIAVDELGSIIPLARAICSHRTAIQKGLKQIFKGTVTLVCAGTGLQLLTTTVGSKPSSTAIVQMENGKLLEELMPDDFYHHILAKDTTLLAMCGNRRVAATVTDIWQPTSASNYLSLAMTSHKELVERFGSGGVGRRITDYLVIQGACGYKHQNGLSEKKPSELDDTAVLAARAVFFPNDINSVAGCQLHKKMQLLVQKGLVDDVAKKIPRAEFNKTQHVVCDVDQEEKRDESKHVGVCSDEKDAYRIVHDPKYHSRYRMACSQAVMMLLRYGQVVPERRIDGAGWETITAMFFQLLLHGTLQIHDAPPITIQQLGMVLDSRLVEVLPNAQLLSDKLSCHQLDCAIGLRAPRKNQAATEPPGRKFTKMIPKYFRKMEKGTAHLVSPAPKSPSFDKMVATGELALSIQDKDVKKFALLSMCDELMKMGFILSSDKNDNIKVTSTTAADGAVTLTITEEKTPTEKKPSVSTYSATDATKKPFGVDVAKDICTALECKVCVPVFTFSEKSVATPFKEKNMYAIDPVSGKVVPVVVLGPDDLHPLVVPPHSTKRPREDDSGQVE